MSEGKSEALVAGTPREVFICHVTVDGGLNIRTQPDTTANSQVVFTAPTGTTLNYYEKVAGQKINDINCWGHSVEDHYYWLGGTDSPWCN